jgi:hypothetical protein
VTTIGRFGVTTEADDTSDEAEALEKITLHANEGKGSGKF